MDKRKQRQLEIEAGLQNIPDYLEQQVNKEAGLRFLIGFCLREKKVAEGIQVFDHFLKYVEELKSQNKNINLKKIGQSINSLLYLLVESDVEDDGDEVKTNEVMRLFNFLKDNDQVSENTYSILIKFYAQLGKKDVAFDLIGEMRENGIQPHLRSYRPLIEVASDVEFLDTVYNYLKKQGLVPDAEFFERIFWKLKELEIADFNKWEDFLKDYQEHHWVLEESLAGLIENVFGELTDRTPVNRSGKCLKNDQELVSIDLTPTQKKILATLLYNRQTQTFQAFNKFLHKRKFDYDVVIDGANVALFNNSEFATWRIMKVSQMYLERGKRVLIVLNHKRKNGELLTFAEISNNVQIYWTPSGVYDDWVWLYASLRTTKPKVAIITNDKMCDHIYYTFPNFFKIWLERHQATYTINPKNKKIYVKEPSVYSRRIQVHNGVWYFPVEGQKEWLYLTPTK